jgi:cysteinyl-tRNA synthetase
VSLKIYNTLTRQKEPFTPLVPGEVGMYVCGVTPYDVSHIGHARSALVFDVVVRYLRYRGYRVTFVKNYTDVDDKIIARANQRGVTIDDLTERYIKAYQDDMAKLGVTPPTEAPRATEHIPEMVGLIERLVAASVAYVVDGDVYFEVARFPAYGRLSGKNLDELLAGARVDVNERKRDPRDFALWKAAKPGEPSWPSPWGLGRPGWHIECSAMAMKYLGQTFDLHGGGEDLVFPHHSCEIAQSEAATGKPFARYWLHNAFVNLRSEKMSKSLGNVLTIEALLQRHDPEALRLYLLSTHYRSPVDFIEAGVEEKATALKKLRAFVEEAAGHGDPVVRSDAAEPTEAGARALLAEAGQATRHAEILGCYGDFVDGLDNDFNAPQAVAAIFNLKDVLQQSGDLGINPGSMAGLALLRLMARTLGLLERREGIIRSREFGSPTSQVGHRSVSSLETKIETLVEQRVEAKRQRNWQRADEFRQKLEQLGVVVAIKDTANGTTVVTWKDSPTD